MIVVCDKEYILFHFNIILKHNGMPSIKIIYRADKMNPVWIQAVHWLATSEVEESCILVCYNVLTHKQYME